MQSHKKMKLPINTVFIAFLLLSFPATVLAHGPSAALGVIALILALLPAPTAILIAPRGRRKRFAVYSALAYFFIWLMLVLLPLNAYSILFAIIAGFILIPMAIVVRIRHRRTQNL